MPLIVSRTKLAETISFVPEIVSARLEIVAFQALSTLLKFLNFAVKDLAGLA